jgi:hypothetical protein
VPDSIESLVLDLLEWLGPEPRDYHEVLEAWRTSCPRLPVWEEALARGLVTRGRDRGRACVLVTPEGAGLLQARRLGGGASR